MAVEEPDDGLLAELIVKLLADRGIAAHPIWPISGATDREKLCRRSEVVDTLDRQILANRKRMTLSAARQALTDAGLIGRAVRRA
jgi:hypothetical protein